MNKLSIIILGLVLISLTGGAMAAKLTDEQKINYLHTLWDSELSYRMIRIAILDDLMANVSQWKDLL